MQVNFSTLPVTALTMSERLFISCLFLKDWSLKASTEYLDSVIQWKKSRRRLTKVCLPCFIDPRQAHNMSIDIACIHMLTHTQTHFRLMRQWHISDGLVSIWESRSLTCPSHAGFQCGQTGVTWGDTNHGMYSHWLKTPPLCWDSAVAFMRTSLSWPNAVWILTVRKTQQQWDKLFARSACGISSMTECHSSSQHCGVQSASTSRPRPALESMHNRGEVKIKQARRMIAAPLQKYRMRDIFFLSPQSLYSPILNVMW